MRYAKHLYLTEEMEERKARILQKLQKRKLQREVFLLAITNQGEGYLEIVSSLELLQSSYPSEKLFIVGLAGDYEDALELVRQITEEVYHQTGDTRIVEYLKHKDWDE